MKDIEEEVTEKHLEEHSLGEHLSLEFTKKKGKGTLGIFDIMHVEKGKKPVELTFSSGDHDLVVKLPTGRTYVYGDVLRLLYDQNKDEMDGVAVESFKSHAVPEPQALWLPALQAKHGDQAPDVGKDASCSQSSMIMNIWLF